jgi:hypothetical protein
MQIGGNATDCGFGTPNERTKPAISFKMRIAGVQEQY